MDCPTWKNMGMWEVGQCVSFKIILDMKMGL